MRIHLLALLSPINFIPAAWRTGDRAPSHPTMHFLRIKRGVLTKFSGFRIPAEEYCHTEHVRGLRLDDVKTHDLISYTSPLDKSLIFAVTAYS